MRIEEQIESWVATQAWERYGVPSIKLNIRGNTGWPDRLFILPGGRALWIEFKAPGEEPDPKQELQHKVLRHRHHDIQVHDNREEALAAVKAALDAARLHEAGGPVRAGARRRRAAP